MSDRNIEFKIKWYDFLISFVICYLTTIILYSLFFPRHPPIVESAIIIVGSIVATIASSSVSKKLVQAIPLKNIKWWFYLQIPLWFSFMYTVSIITALFQGNM